MKWDSKAVGRLIVTLILMSCAVVFMFMYPDDVWGAVAFVLILVIWDFMYYKDFDFIKIGKNGATATLNKDRNKNLSKKSPSEKSKENFHKEFEQFKFSKPDLDVIMLEGYESPSRLTEFVNLVKKAKTNGYDLSSDSAYQELAKDYRQHIYYQLKTVLETLDYSSEFSDRLQKLLEDAMLSVPTNQEVIANIKEELVSANENSKLEISDVFFKATNDLKKLEL